ncbi:MAG TPA: HAMP domain-containing sensor histidine kinase [Candidatus Acidoferrales bacterium]|nr:HAMP domain-containing sensor histidine kinase [Candidatus Acidoferrales bacterium]
MRLPIRLRVALYVTFTFAAVIVVLGFALMELYERYSKRSFDVTLQAAASSVANRLAKENMHVDVADISEDVGETISSFESKIGIIGVGIFDGSWKQIFSYNDKASIAIRAEIKNWARADDRKELTTVRLPGEKYRCALANFEITDGSQGTVVTFGSLSSIRESIERMRTIIFIAAPLTILLVGVGSILIARRALRPLERIASSIDGIQVEKSLEKLEVPETGDEIKKVAESFNSLVQRIGSLIDTQRNFLLDASHELKTPLTVIQTEMEMLLMKPGLSAAERANLRQLLSEVEYASKLAVDIIYLSRLESSMVVEMRPFNLGTVLEEVAAHHLSLAKRKNVNLRIKYEPDIVVNADDNLLKRAVSNVIDNSIKFSHAGGEVWVTGTRDEKLSAAVVTVEDRGEGISSEELPRIFDKFYRTKSSRSMDEKGSGLGLSIAKRIVEQHGGKIEIESRPGVGTTVRIDIPEARIAAPSG